MAHTAPAPTVRYAAHVAPGPDTGSLELTIIKDVRGGIHGPAGGMTCFHFDEVDNYLAGRGFTVGPWTPRLEDGALVITAELELDA